MGRRSSLRKSPSQAHDRPRHECIRFRSGTEHHQNVEKGEMSCHSLDMSFHKTSKSRLHTFLLPDEVVNDGLHP
eukprot:3600942-Amphidinium_carterae.1